MCLLDSTTSFERNAMLRKCHPVIQIENMVANDLVNILIGTDNYPIVLLVCNAVACQPPLKGCYRIEEG